LRKSFEFLFFFAFNSILVRRAQLLAAVMFWKFNTLSTSELDSLLDRAARAKEASKAQEKAGGESQPEPEPIEEEEQPLTKEEEVKEEEQGQNEEVRENGESSSSPELPATVAPVALKDILEQEDVIQECKNQNKKLVD